MDGVMFSKNYKNNVIVVKGGLGEMNILSLPNEITKRRLF